MILGRMIGSGGVESGDTRWTRTLYALATFVLVPVLDIQGHSLINTCIIIFLAFYNMRLIDVPTCYV
jgi:hypothetical protein